MKIPEKVTQYSVYRNGSEYLGTADIELPSFEYLSESRKGAGIAGEIDSPTIGHFGPMSVTINWLVMLKAAISLLAPEQHALDFRVASQTKDSSTGGYSTSITRIAIRSVPKSLDLGSLENGAASGTSNVLEVEYIKIFMDGVAVLELDKLNSVFIVNGKDYLAEQRAAL
ncbi:phage major tail tube protein [Paenibacillus sp. MCAF20]